MNLFTKRLGLVLAGVVGVGAIASLAIGASFALFTSTTTPLNQTFDVGTVVATQGTSEDAVITDGYLAPGDFYCGLGGAEASTGLDCNSAYSTLSGSTDYPASYGVGGYYDIEYQGTLDAWIGLNYSITATAACNANGTAPGGASTAIQDLCASGGGTEPIWNGGGSGATALLASDGYNNDTEPNEFVNMNPTSGVACTNYPDTTATQNTCTYTSTTPSLLTGPRNLNDIDSYWNYWQAGDSEDIYLVIYVPLTDGNAVQGGTVTVSVSATAVQARNNTSCTAETYSPPLDLSEPYCQQNYAGKPTSWS